jgi:peptide/nickel transport system ATP-binding protein
VTPLLQAQGLARRFPIRMPGGLIGRRATLHAVDDVSFDVARGETLGLVGESGCGKSTTARLALGLIAPSAGTVRFDGEPMAARGTPAWRSARRRMQMVYQDPLAVLDRRLPVITQVIEPLTIFEVGAPHERTARAAALLAEVGLGTGLQSRFPHELSGGQRQRVVLARALATDPALLACDEPISALDVSIQAQVLNLLADLQARRGIAMLFISHDLRAVRQISQRIAVMYLGRIVEEGDPDVLFRRPQHPYTQALVSAIPLPPRHAAAAEAARKSRILLEGDPPSPIDRPSGCAFHPRCPIAVPRCREVAPVTTSLGGSHRVACHQVGGPACTAMPDTLAETV